VDMPDDKGLTALHNAALAGQADVAAYLIYKGADVNAQDLENEETPLHYAVKAELVEMCALLVSKKADWSHTKNKQGLTAIALAKQFKHPDIMEFFQILESEASYPAVNLIN
jgi:ankyrin repeat protein